MPDSFNGLIAATHTPMHPDDGGVNLDVIDQQAEDLTRQGVAGAFICGTTGEGISISTSERMTIAERWITAAKANNLRLIVHVAHNTLDDARALAAHAADHGADGIAFMGPTFFRPANVDDLIAVCEPIAQAAASVPFYFYHIPSLTSIRVSIAAFLQQGSRRITNLAGVKFTEPDLWEFQRCQALHDGRFEMFFGCDEMLLGAMAIGARGAVGSTYNYAASIYINMIRAYENGDMTAAQHCSQQAVALVAVIKRYGVIQAGKALMARRGIDCGPVTWPLQLLSTSQINALYAEVDALGLPAK